MNARISRKFTFQSAIHFDGKFIINSYEIVLFMDVTTDDIREQNIAMDRIKYLFDMSLDSCVFIDMKNTKFIDLYDKAGIAVCTLPDEPYDQVVAAILLCKINTITEGHLFCTEIEIKSKICDDVVFNISHEEEIELQNSSDMWWNENNSNIRSYVSKTKKEKVVELKKEPIDWNSLGLTWKEEKKKGEIVLIPVGK